MSGLKRGTIFLIWGWAIQLIAGYFLNIWLARRFGPEIYGTYGVVMGLLLWIEVGTISGIPTAIQKFVASNENRAKAILRESCQLQFVGVSVLFVVVYACAPYIGRVLKDTFLASQLRVALWDIWVYSYFFIFMSLQNGLHRFAHQAILIGVYSASRLAFVFLYVSLLHTITGAFIANIAGSAVGLALSLVFLRAVRIKAGTMGFGRRKIFKFAMPVAFFSLGINLLLNVDLWMVKYFIGGKSPGYYTAASTIARIPYILFFGLSATVLPALSKALADEDKRRIESTIQGAVRFLLLAAAPIAALVLSYREPLMVLLYKAEYRVGGEILGVLIWGMSLLALFFLLTTIINVDNKPLLSSGITFAVVCVDLLLNRFLVPVYGVVGAAYSTTSALFLGCLMAGLIVFRRFHVLVCHKTVLRVGFASASIYLMSLNIKVAGVPVIWSISGLLGCYGLLLILLREVSFSEISQFIQVIKKDGGNG